MNNKESKQNKLEQMSDEQLQKVSGGVSANTKSKYSSYQNCVRVENKSTCCNQFPDAIECKLIR